MLRFALVSIWSCAVLSLPSIAVAAEPSAKTGEWPQWRGPNRDGLSADKGLNKDWNAKPPKLLWTAEKLGSGYASVSLAGGKIYTTGNFPDGQAVLCVNAADGKLLWKQPLTDSAPRHSRDGARSTPSIDGDRIYVVASSGEILCLKTADGQIAWRKDFKTEWNGKLMSGWGFSESPLVDGDLVLCTPGGSSAMMVALDKQSGKEVWKSNVPKFGGDVAKNGKNLKDGAAYSSIVVSNGAKVKQYVQFIGRGVVGVQASDGKFLWGYSDVANGTANVPTPIVRGDFVFCSSGYQTGAALLKLVPDGDGVKAEEQYFLESRTAQNHHGGMVLVGDHVYLGHGHNAGAPLCVEMASGKVAWGPNTSLGRGSAAVTYADGLILYRYESGDLALVGASPMGFNLLGTLKPAYQEGTSWAHPVIVGGRLYLREQSKLMCYDVSEAS